MSKSSIMVLTAATLLFGLALPDASAQIKLPRPSPKGSVTQTVGLTDVSITYSRPGVKGRTIWGALVPWDKVWRTGANEATTITLSNDVKVNGQPLAAGTYSLHSIPGKDEWTLIFNSVAAAAGYSYDAAKDVLRVKVKPERAEFSELFSFAFPTVSPDMATVALRWENVQVPFTITADTRAQTMAGLRESLSKAKADDWRIRYQAAQYAIDNGSDSAQGLKWLDESLAISKTYQNLRLKAETYARAGDTRRAIATAEAAVAAGKASKVDTSAVEALLAKWRKP